VTSQDSIHKCIQNAFTIAVKRIFSFHNRPTPKSMSAGDLTRKLTALPTSLRGRSEGKDYKGETGEYRDGKGTGEVGE